MEKYDSNGVKVRSDGGGDGWALAHRDLGATFNMSDIDGMMGNVTFASNTGDKFFIEYLPDDYQNRNKSIRRFATVALFDRKNTRENALGTQNVVSMAFHLDMCRRLAVTQPVPPKFFYVIGSSVPPWQMLEMNINTGEVIKEYTIEDGTNWKQVWELAGLMAIREELGKWIQK